MNRIDLAGRTAIVTGAVKGIGRAITDHFSRRRARHRWDIDAEGWPPGRRGADHASSTSPMAIRCAPPSRPPSKPTAVWISGQQRRRGRPAGRRPGLSGGRLAAGRRYRFDRHLCRQAVAPHMVAAGYGRIVISPPSPARKARRCWPPIPPPRPGSSPSPRCWAGNWRETGVIATCRAGGH